MVSTVRVRFWSGRQSLGGLSVCYRDAWECMHPEEAGHTLAIASCDRIFDEQANGIWASDHFGLVADKAHHQNANPSELKDGRSHVNAANLLLLRVIGCSIWDSAAILQEQRQQLTDV
jgi:hypothetical protein